MMNETIPQGVKTIAELAGEDPQRLWNGLQNTLNSAEKIALFDTTVNDTVARMKNAYSNEQIAIAAMSQAGEAILGPNRPPRPGSVEDLLEQAVATGIMRRVRP